MFPPAARFQPYGTTIFAEMTALANRCGAVNLAQGFPDFDGPEFIKAAAARAMQQGHNQYARMQGVPELNAAIVARWKHATGQAIDGESQVTVTSGCTEALAATFLGLLNPGDEVILFEPWYDCYHVGATMAGARVRGVTLHASEPGRPRPGFSFNPGELANAFTPKTRAIVINTPHNPTGKVFSRDELALIAGLCQEHNTVAITDEVYEHLTFDPAQPHIPIATLPGMADCTITLSSLGKSFSLTGWKIGWAIASAELTRAVRAAHQFLVFCSSTPLQHGAAAALTPGGEGEAHIASLRAQLREARDYLSGALTELGFVVYPPAGTYFIMADHTRLSPRLGIDPEQPGADVAFCRALTEKIGVAAIPPSPFYEDPARGRRLARFAFCKRSATLEEAVRRLQTLRA
ncbi:MAG: aminotransferase class I/II-fold pyridoxal phosphate-dependent enzyme [Phycisphaerales bacterium]